MIGFYDYTVILTYLSMISATCGIILCLNSVGHPYIGMLFLLLCGLCDAFDGKVARTKKNRTERMKKFGIQIDSLSDLIAFGVLPACIGIAMMRSSIYYETLPSTIFFIKLTERDIGIKVVITMIALFYTLAALIRLAFFNVLEEERNEAEETGPRYFHGLPVTSAALVFPTVLLCHIVFSMDLTYLYSVLMAVMGILFISDIKVKKPTTKDIIAMIAFGAVEAIVLGLIFIFLKNR
ncbi:MAG: CDP-alcohol phosphatidyltransferase family protein [Spirochaetia bacterium]|nr:CDP-alcohol phosphatidyltransferase family protein [Spirochaetia bacterium]